MRIALCHPYILPAKGGCEHYIIDLSQRLRRDGHEVHWHAWRWDEQRIPDRVRCFRVRGPENPWRHRRPWLFARACLRSLRQVPHDVSIGFDKTWGQDILFPQGGLYRETALGNRRVPRTVLGRWLVTSQQWLDPAYWSFLQLEQLQYAKNDPLIVVNSQMVGRHFATRFPWAKDRVHVVPSAIDSARFDARMRDEIRWRERANWRLSQNKVVGLFAAMNYSLKGLNPLLRAIRNLPSNAPFELLIVGSSCTRQACLRAAWHGVDDRVRFVGHCADMRRAYFAADLLVHPTFYDPCSLVVLEALACGLPVITSRHNGASELPHVAEAGHIIDDPHDELALAQSIVRLLDPEERHRCGQAARDAADSWTLDDHYRGLVKVIELARTRKGAFKREVRAA